MTNERIPKLPLAVVLTLKAERDPENFDPERLAELLMRALPDPESIPAYFVERWSLREDF